LGHAIHAGEAIRVVVNVVGGDRRTASPGANGLAEAVARRIVAVLEVAAIAVAGGGQAIERVVAVVDRRRGRALRRGKGKVGDGARGEARKDTDGWDLTDPLNPTHPVFSPPGTDTPQSVDSSFLKSALSKKQLPQRRRMGRENAYSSNSIQALFSFYDAT
jgi:hypothetical protein